VPLIITSVSFGLLHYWNPEVAKIGPLLLVHYVSTGLFFGIITLMDKGLELSLGFHAGNNILIALLVTADWTVFQTNSVLKSIGEPKIISMIIPLFIIYPLVLFYFSKKYNWSDWKENLTGKFN
jgi:membrane protease YdiL (CAAX protease family)